MKHLKLILAILLAAAIVAGLAWLTYPSDRTACTCYACPGVPGEPSWSVTAGNRGSCR